MHIEPGLVAEAKMVLSYATGAAAVGVAGKMAIDSLRAKTGLLALVARTFITSILVLGFFEVLPHQAVGVSEVHLILGSTLFLIFGAAPAALGLAIGLLAQGLFLAPFDLPQYGMNVTTLLVPLFGLHYLAKRIIPAKTAYKDVTYKQALALSTSYQGGIVLWVGFWALYGQGFAIENLTSVASFGLAYMSVIILEPLVDLAVLAIAKHWHKLADTGLVHKRLYQPA